MIGKIGSGVKTSWGATHRDKGGKLISRQTSIEAPEIKCMKCVGKYLKDSIYYALLMKYHARRVLYAEAHRNEEIEEKYRTGNPAPENIRQTIVELIKLGGKG